jgi:hypothetical protein
MGAAVSMADGLYQAGRLVGDSRPIIASIGDSTFIHSGIVPLINAVHTDSRFVLIILDNHTTAMTGFQPTAEATELADGTPAARSASIPDLVRACGVDFIEVTDPYNQEAFRQLVRSAYEHTQSAEGGVAVVVADRPCVLYDPVSIQEHPIPVDVTEECDGCRYCTEAFAASASMHATKVSSFQRFWHEPIECGHAAPDDWQYRVTRLHQFRLPGSDCMSTSDLKVLSVVIAGIGGQGVIFTTRLLTFAAIRLGLPAIAAESHGMSQRGGSVVSHLRVGRSRTV